jgi:hypothetical protein
MKSRCHYFCLQQETVRHTLHRGGFEDDAFEALVSAYKQSLATNDSNDRAGVMTLLVNKSTLPMYVNKEPKKKQKSNNHVVATLSKVVINHSLSNKELEHLRGLKKTHLMEELKKNNVKYYTSWRKSGLLKAMLVARENENAPNTQPKGIDKGSELGRSTLH